MKYLLALLCIVIALQGSCEESCASRHAVSYEGSARFGDRMLGYTQARYVSYVSSVPFLYRPFPYSEHLNIEFQALPFDEHAHKYARTLHIHSERTLLEFFRQIRDPNTPPTLFIVDYFPAEISEWDKDQTRCLLINVPWYEEGFSTYLKNSSTPRVPIPNLRQEGCLNVAVHVRTLSGDDTAETSILVFPMKVTTTGYQKRQIKRVYEWNLGRPMYVFLFSDTKDPTGLLREFENHFQGHSITFGIQLHERADLNHVVQDFFAMHAFDVLIATQSNFSMMSWRLGSFDMVLFPARAAGAYPNTYIDRVQVISRKSEWFPYALDLILKEDLQLLASAPNKEIYPPRKQHKKKR
jgi:hypothetical protein